MQLYILNMYNCIHVQETLSCVNKGLRMLGEEKDLMRQNLVSLSSSAFLLLPRSVQTLVIQIGQGGSATFQSSHQLNRSLVTCLLTCCSVGVNALLAEHWAVNHRSGGYSCTFDDQFPHQTPGSVVAAAQSNSSSHRWSDQKRVQEKQDWHSEPGWAHQASFLHPKSKNRKCWTYRCSKW